MNYCLLKCILLAMMSIRTFHLLLQCLVLQHQIVIESLLTSYQAEYQLKKIETFEIALERIMSNLANGRANLKFNNSVLVRKSLSLSHGKFFLNLYIAYELNTWPSNPTNDFLLKTILFGTANQSEMHTKVNLLIMVQEQHLMEKASGFLVMTLLEVL